MKARRKPLLFDYIQFHPSNRQQVCNLVGHDGTGEHHECPVTIKTLEGNVYANVGDFIMTGVNGEHWPVKPDVFEKSSDIVEEPGNETTPACDVAKAIAESLVPCYCIDVTCYPGMVPKHATNCPRHYVTPYAIAAAYEKALADARRDGEEAEAKRWQDAIDKVVYAEDDERDGSGCDSGDPLDVCLTEIQGAFNVWHNRLHDQGLRLIGKGRAAKIAPEASNSLDDSGQVRRVLGTLPILASGEVCGIGYTPWLFDNIDNDVYQPLMPWVETSDLGWCWINRDCNEFAPSMCYSTREAALAAKEPRP